MPSKKPKKRPVRKSSARKATTRKSPARKGKAKSATGKIPLDVLEKRLARLTRTVKARGGKVPG
jgi:hypothetical protein